MKLIDKIAYTTFLINIFALLFYFIGMPFIAITNPNLFFKLAVNQGLNPYNLAMTLLSTAVFFHWGYCIWFLFKYDRYSKSIFPLFFLNAFYAPIYYYRVKIKKRPLRNKINTVKAEQVDNSMNEDEFIELTRKNIVGVIQLWSSKEEQLEYQKSVPIAQVSNELFMQWTDFYTPDAEVIKEAFTSTELELLTKFNIRLTEIAKVLNGNIAYIDKFIGTNEWKELNLLASEILRDLK